MPPESDWPDGVPVPWSSFKISRRQPLEELLPNIEPEALDLMKVNYGYYYGHPIGQAIIFCSCGFFFLFSSPILSSWRLDVYHTSTHDVALIRI